MDRPLQIGTECKDVSAPCKSVSGVMPADGQMDRMTFSVDTSETPMGSRTLVTT